MTPRLWSLLIDAACIWCWVVIWMLFVKIGVIDEKYGFEREVSFLLLGISALYISHKLQKRLLR